MSAKKKELKDDGLGKEEYIPLVQFMNQTNKIQFFKVDGKEYRLLPDESVILRPDEKVVRRLVYQGILKKVEVLNNGD